MKFLPLRDPETMIGWCEEGFFGRRMWGGGGWGHKGGYGYGPGRSFEERAQEWHKRQHGEQPPSGETPPPPPTDARSV